jgi:nucleoside triphosphate diphosphatase
MSAFHKARTLDRSIDLVMFLRDNCPWDAAQTPQSLLPYLLEEAHETAEAVTSGNDNELRSELGDLLLNVAFQIVLAEERQAFDPAMVIDELEGKMRRRHPHIDWSGYRESALGRLFRSLAIRKRKGHPHLYGDGPPVPWEELKAQERAAASEGEATLLSGLNKTLDPLSKAHRIQERVSTVGFDWADARGAFQKVAEELEEVREEMESGDASALEEELGDLLFAVVNLTRLAGAHSMQALQRANQKFTARFDALELLARDRGVELGKASLEELDLLWDEVKARGKGSTE